MLGRRTVLTGAAAAGLLGSAAARTAEPRALFGLIGKFSAKPGQRAALIAAILESGAMPGCLSYVVAEDASAPDDIWVTEVWETKAAHDASLQLPAVRAAIAKARPLISGYSPGAETRPIGGVGL
jgi:quinol monooxygenase YgiN